MRDLLKNQKIYQGWILVLLLFLLGAPTMAETLDVNNTFHENSSSWKISGYFSADCQQVFSKDPSSWRFRSSKINTDINKVFSSDWSLWRSSSGSGELKATFSKNYSDWKLKGEGYDLSVQTVFSKNHTSWRVSGSHSGSIEIHTIFSSSFYGGWRIRGDLKELPDEAQALVCFIPILSTVLKENNLIVE